LSAHPLAALGRINFRHAAKLASGAKLQRELVTLMNDCRLDARYLSGGVRKSNETTVADEELGLQNDVGFLVADDISRSAFEPERATTGDPKMSSNFHVGT
jgi:hypothetical protein